MRGARLRVKEIMDGKHPSIYMDELATKARAMMRDFNLRILPVTDGNKKLLGKVSRRDVMTISSSKSPIFVKGMMTPAKHVAFLDDDVNSTVKTMLKVDVWCAPVVTSSQDGTYGESLGWRASLRSRLRRVPKSSRRMWGR